MPPDPPTVSGLRPSVSQGTCLLTSQCPSTSKVKENPDYVKLDLLCSAFLLDHYNKMMETQVVGAVLVKDPLI